MNRLLIIGILLMVIGPVSLLAQLEAPALLCVSNDTLVWDIPTVSCATPDGYRILASESESGPYSELATITDLTQTSFFHADAGIATWFYYMETIANCPGTNPVQSDTLDNRNPEVPLFRYVSVEDGQVVMEWDASPSPEVRDIEIFCPNKLKTDLLYLMESLAMDFKLDVISRQKC